jgi:hypothetical protein
MKGESEGTKFSLDTRKNEKDRFPKGLDPAISNFFVQLPHKFQNIVKVNHEFCGLKFSMNLDLRLTDYFFTTESAEQISKT